MIPLPNDVMRYVYLCAGGALAVWGTVQWAQKKDALLELSNLSRAVAEVNAARADVARRHEAELSKRESGHRAATEKLEEYYASKTADLVRVAAADRRESQRLRDKLIVATARGSSGNPTDPATCGRAEHRLEALGGLAGEGAELLVEARILLRQRDADVQLLLEQIVADREAVSGQSE